MRVKRTQAAKDRSCCRAVELLMSDGLNERLKWTAPVGGREAARPDFFDDARQDLVRAEGCLTAV
jgi:hypothetical protein